MTSSITPSLHSSTLARGSQQELFSKSGAIDNLALNHHALYMKALKFREIRIALHNDDIWKAFSEHGTEMVITKTGRRMFPIVQTSVYNLDPNTYYFVMLDIVRADEKRYMYIGNQWVTGGRSQSLPPPRLFFHPDSPAPGSKWMEAPISFHRVKLTNNAKDTKQNIILSSMHKYVVRLHIVEGSDITLLPWCRFSIFPLEETSFIAVTAYQNPQIVDLKIENNPFARGFLCPQRHKKRLSPMEDFEESYRNITHGICTKKQRKEKCKVAEADATLIYEKSNHLIPKLKFEPTTRTAVPFDKPLTIDTSFPNLLWRNISKNYNYSQSSYSINNFGLPAFLPIPCHRSNPPIFPLCHNYYNSKHLLMMDTQHSCTNGHCNGYGTSVGNLNLLSESYLPARTVLSYNTEKTITENSC